MMRRATFKWGALSQKQFMVLSWWRPESRYCDYNGIIADGSIRSGKTVSMSFSFVVWAMETFDGQKFAMCGKTIESLRRNVITTLKAQLSARNYFVRERRSENLIIITKNGKTNNFYLFGGKDESSQDLIQGITLAGAFFDEVALMPQSFVNQATARCSVDGSKWWFNCNPANPSHYFYTEWIRKCRSKKLMYLHFTMADNLTLTQAIRDRYEAQYTGVFYDRYILGLWVAAEGLIYDMFKKDIHVVDELPKFEGDWYVSSDFGINNPNCFLLWRKESGKDTWVCCREYYYSGRENKKQKTVAQLASDLKDMLDGRMPEDIILDPSATAMKVELQRLGYNVRGADNEVVAGIQDVQSMLHSERLKFHASCKRTIKEFGLYLWDEKKANKGEDAPIKTNDHAMDAVRYFVRTMGFVKWADDDGQYKSLLG